VAQDIQHTSSKLTVQDIAGRALGIGLALAICAAGAWLAYAFIIPLLVFFGLCGSIFVQIRRAQGIPAADDFPPVLSAACYAVLLAIFLYHAANPAYQIWILPYVGMFSVLAIATKIASIFVAFTPAVGGAINLGTRVAGVLYPTLIISVLFGVLKA
jgi:hypothetical protein